MAKSREIAAEMRLIPAQRYAIVRNLYHTGLRLFCFFSPRAEIVKGNAIELGRPPIQMFYSSNHVRVHTRTRQNAFIKTPSLGSRLANPEVACSKNLLIAFIPALKVGFRVHPRLPVFPAWINSFFFDTTMNSSRERLDPAQAKANYDNASRTFQREDKLNWRATKAR
jgi:hypothetical protein